MLGETDLTHYREQSTISQHTVFKSDCMLVFKAALINILLLIDQMQGCRLRMGLWGCLSRIIMVKH